MRALLQPPPPTAAACRLTTVSRRAAALCRPVAARAAAFGASGGAEYDPYAVLGVHPLAGADEFARARSRRVKDAGADEAAAAAAEAAYDAIVMRQLALRMKGQGPLGGVAVSNSVAFADRGVRHGGRCTKRDLSGCSRATRTCRDSCRRGRPSAPLWRRRRWE